MKEDKVQNRRGACKAAVDAEAAEQQVIAQVKRAYCQLT